MGSLYGQKCFTSNSEASDAYFTAKEPSYTAGSTSYLSYFEKVGSTWMIVRKSISSTGTITNLTSSTAPVPTFPTCDETAGFVDGMTVGWGIAAAMIAAWAFHLMAKATR